MLSPGEGSTPPPEGCGNGKREQHPGNGHDVGVQVAKQEAEGGHLGDSEGVGGLGFPVGHAGHAPPDPVVVGVPVGAGGEGLAGAGLVGALSATREALHGEGLVDAVMVGAVGGGELEDTRQRAAEEQEDDPSRGGERDPAAGATPEYPAGEGGAEGRSGGSRAREHSAQREVVAGSGPDIGPAREDGGLQVATIVVARALARKPGVVGGILGGDEHRVQVEEVHRLLGVSDVGNVSAEVGVAEEERREEGGGHRQAREGAAEGGEETPIAGGQHECGDGEEGDREEDSSAAGGERTDNAEKEVASADEREAKRETETRARIGEAREEAEGERQRERRDHDGDGPEGERLSHGAASCKERIDERLGIEGGKVAETLAGADEANGHSELTGDGEHDAATGGAVELGEDESGDADGLGEGARLEETILPGRGIEHQQGLVGRLGIAALDDAGDLLQLLHQVRLGVEPSGRVDEGDGGAIGLGRGEGIEDDGAGVAAGLVGDDPHVEPVAPDPELVDGGCAEGVGGGEDGEVAPLLERPRELRDGGGLARAVYADDQDDEQLGEGSIPAGRPGGRDLEDGDELGSEDVAHLGGGGGASLPHLLAHVIEDAFGGGDTGVGGDEDLLKLVPEVVVEVGTVEETAHTTEEAGAAAGERAPGLRLDLLDLLGREGRSVGGGLGAIGILPSSPESHRPRLPAALGGAARILPQAPNRC